MWQITLTVSRSSATVYAQHDQTECIEAHRLNVVIVATRASIELLLWESESQLGSIFSVATLFCHYMRSWRTCALITVHER